MGVRCGYCGIRIKAAMDFWEREEDKCKLVGDLERAELG